MSRSDPNRGDPNRGVRVEFIAVGSELLSGKVNTHTAFLSQRLSEVGLSFVRETSVNDDIHEMKDVFREAIDRSDVVITSGGLGPTFDDLTREAWAKVLGVKLIRREELVKEIFDRYARRGYQVPEENARQGDVLQGAVVISNKVGAAPGQFLEIQDRFLFLLPGPLNEMCPMVEEVVLEKLKKRYPSRIKRSITLRVFSVPESMVAEKIDPVIRKDRSGLDVEIQFSILAHCFVVDIKATVVGNREVRVAEVLAGIKEEFSLILKEDVFGEGNQELEDVVGDLLVKRQATLAVAESCTGGLLAEKITRVAGSSLYFREGVITYSNEAKKRYLGVSDEMLKSEGAVSDACAREMARGMRQKSGTDYALSVTGIAGPSGGTSEKPVGLVYIACNGEGGEVCCKKIFSGTRQEIREKSTLFALDLLRRQILNIA